MRNFTFKTFGSSLHWISAVAIALLASRAGAIDCPDNTKEKGIGGAFPLEVVCVVESGPSRGLRHGPYERFFKDGGVRESGRYLNGAKDGVWKFWHGTGEFAGELTYQRARRHGNFKNLAADGSLIAEGTYFLDKKHGVWRTKEGEAMKTQLYQMGTLVDVPNIGAPCPAGAKVVTSEIPERKGSREMLTVNACNDESGTRQGTTWTLSPDGDVAMRQDFVDGIPDGPYIAWLPSGMIKMDGMFRKGKKTGLWRVFTRDGTPASEIPLKDGLKHGTVIRFHDNGRKSEEGAYSMGLPDGAFFQWNDEGKLLGTTLFIEGSGTWTTWHPNGEIAEEGELVDGRRDGEWKKFKPDGWVAEKAIYANGRRVSR